MYIRLVFCHFAVLSFHYIVLLFFHIILEDNRSYVNISHVGGMTIDVKQPLIHTGACKLKVVSYNLFTLLFFKFLEKLQKVFFVYETIFCMRFLHLRRDLVFHFLKCK